MASPIISDDHELFSVNAVGKVKNLGVIMISDFE